MNWFVTTVIELILAINDFIVALFPNTPGSVTNFIQVIDNIITVLPRVWVYCGYVYFFFPVANFVPLFGIFLIHSVLRFAVSVWTLIKP